jgi:exopolysaccharide biosynthesis WecB/TagA/CpsF family protein
MSGTRPPALLFGVPIDDLTMDESIDAVGTLVADGRRHGRTHQIATVNVDFLVNALADPEVRRLLQDASLNVADGLPVVWSARLAGMPLRERVTGADLVPALAAAAAGRGWRIHFFGSAPGVAERALDLLRARHPDAQLTGTSGPFMADVTDVDDAVLDEIAAHDPDIVCVALGNPKQERFIAAHRDRLGAPVMIGIGGSLDMLVGDKKRAPEWVQRSGTEWVFRAAQEPGRLGKRYAKDAVVFAPRVARYVRALRRHRHGPDVRLADIDGAVTVATCPSGATATAGDDRAATFAAAAARLADGGELAVDLGGGVPHPRALSEVVGLVRIARRFDRPVVDRAVPPAARAGLSALDLPGWVVDGHQVDGHRSARRQDVREAVRR